MQQNVQTKPSIKKSKAPKGETVSELTHRHLRDANHVTSDEELRNVNLELHNDETDQSADTIAEENKPTANDNQDRGTEDVIVSSWDVLR